MSSRISELTELSDPANDDEIEIRDDSETPLNDAQNKRIKKRNFISSGVINNFIRSLSWYGTAINSGESSTVLLVANKLRAFPFIIRKQFPIDRIQFDVFLALAGNCVVGIYDTDTALIYPKTKLVQGTAQSLGSTGLKTDTIASTLLADTLYWLVYHADVAATLRGINVGTVPAVLGNDGTSGFNKQNVGWTADLAYNATLPTTFTPGGTLLIGNVVPLILVRAT